MAREGGRGNPLFAVAKATNKKKLAITFFALVAFGFGIYGAFSFATQDRFYIRTVSFDGIVFLPADQLEQTVQAYLNTRSGLLQLPHRHVWNFDGEKLGRDLEGKWPLSVNNVEEQGSVARVQVTEDVTMVVVTNINGIHLVDLEGVDLKVLSADEAKEERYMRLPQIKVAGDGLPPSDIITDILALSTEANRTQLPISAYRLSTIEDPWVRADLPEGKSILFDLASDPRRQIAFYIAVQSEYTKKEKSFTTIDVRFGDRVYVR